MIPHGLKVSTNQEKVDLVAILPFKLLNAFVDIVELSMAATLDSDLNTSNERRKYKKKTEIYFHSKYLVVVSTRLYLRLRIHNVTTVQ